ncbi:MAG: DUF5652 family protein [Patescibacteria group bacterium]
MENFIIQNPWLVFALIIWILPWKAVALWKSARIGSKAWFIVLLVVNTLGILEILYIYVFSKKCSNSQCCQSNSEKLSEQQIQPPVQ